MITKRTSIDQIEVRADGTIGIRFAKLLDEDGAVLMSEWHRAMIAPGDDPDDLIAAVNDHLREMGCEPVSEDDLPRLRAVVNAVHTPEAIAAFKAAQPAVEMPA